MGGGLVPDSGVTTGCGRGVGEVGGSLGDGGEEGVLPDENLRPLYGIVFTEHAVVPQAHSHDTLHDIGDVVGVGRGHEESAVRAPSS